MVVPQKVKFAVNSPSKQIGAVEVKLHSNSAINEGNWSASLPCPFYPTEISFRYTLNRRLDGPQNFQYVLEKRIILRLPGFDPTTVQSLTESLRMSLKCSTAGLKDQLDNS